MHMEIVQPWRLKWQRDYWEDVRKELHIHIILNAAMLKQTEYFDHYLIAYIQMH